ncbi:MAG TPA: hypothetical protein VIP70_03945 [Nitrososphaeraceae archaeon]
MTEKEDPEISQESSQHIHHCKGYIEDIESLPICRGTIQRAKKCGFNTLEFAESCLNAINQDVTDENTYEDIAKVVQSFANASMPFLEKYQVKDIEVGRFQIRYTSAKAVVYLSQMQKGIILVEFDANAEYSVRTTDTEEIWRYLDEPRHIIEAVLSTIMAYAEKHKAIKDEWILTLQNIKDEYMHQDEGTSSFSGIKEK